MKIIQVNCWAGHLLRPLLKFIKQEQPDILCGQEVMSSIGTSNPLFDSYQTAEHIKTVGNFSHMELSPTWGAEAFGQRVEYGNAIFSRLPIINPRSVFVDSEYKFPQLSTDFKPNIRNLMVCTVAASKNIVIANHHGFHSINPLGSDESVRSARKVADELANVTAPLILCGDLNVIKESPAFEPIARLGLRNLSAEFNIQTTLSDIHDAPNKNQVACDYILCSADIKVRSFREADELVSDHKALVLEFDLV